MKYSESGFRPFYHNFCTVNYSDNILKKIKDLPEHDKADCVLVYGFIKEGVMCFEALARAHAARKYTYFGKNHGGDRIILSVADIKDQDASWFSNDEGFFTERFGKRVEALAEFDNPELDEVRSFEFLDSLRLPDTPDVVPVIMKCEGNEDEVIPVAMTGTDKPYINGILLEEPKQDFGGYHKGDEIKFRVSKDSEADRYVCVSFFSNSPDEDEEEEAGPKIDDSEFKAALAKFKADSNDDTFSAVINVLINSDVLVATEIIISDEARALMDKDGELTDAEKDVIRDGITFEMPTVEVDGDLLIPVYTSEEEMPEDEKHIVLMPFMVAARRAVSGEEDIAAIAVNPAGDTFFIKKDVLTDIVEQNSDEEQESREIRADLNCKDIGIRINCRCLHKFNYSLYQNDAHPVSNLTIQNVSGSEIGGLVLKISSDFRFFKPFAINLPPIPSGKPIKLNDPHIIFNSSVLASLTEAVKTFVTVEVLLDGERVGGIRNEIEVLAYNQFCNQYSLLSSFVMPNSPIIPLLMHDAAEILKKWGKDPSLEGYQRKDPNRVRELAAAAYAAIQSKQIAYANPPASFDGQRIRTPDEVIGNRLGTCMDMSILYASLLEAIGLNTVLYLLDGHIFAGFWQAEDLQFSSAVLDKSNSEVLIRMAKGSDQLCLVECTAMCMRDEKVDFDAAEYHTGNPTLESGKFRAAIDVALSRKNGVKPLPSQSSAFSGVQAPDDLDIDEISDAPAIIDIDITEVKAPAVTAITTKQELWERKLLDLSSHNMLLNMPHNSSVESILSASVDELEDALADGEDFTVLPIPDWLFSVGREEIGEDGKKKDIFWIVEALEHYGIYEMTDWVAGPADFSPTIRQEYKNHRLFTYSDEKDLSKHLTAIYRAAKASQQENGVSSLYLAIGMMRWFDAEDEKYKKPYYAPLILVPIEITRKSANQGYSIHMRDEEPHFNTTLLEMLRQLYNIEIGGLDPLPTDEHGIDIKKAFAIVRSALYTVPNWDVFETCAIGNFSFAQFAMWNDIHTFGDALNESKIVRSLKLGRVDWDENVEEPAPENLYLPITVDATQLEAIRMAAAGRTFVLHGPPGTGKSQTITAMISNLMAQGKTVLFVAEKTAALTVVQRRLAGLGIGDFCLELHSDKANKKHVLTQLESALNSRFKYHDSGYKDEVENASRSRARLDVYAEHLHKVHKCGYSMRDLIDLYESVGNVDNYIKFKPEDASVFTGDDIRKHIPLIEQLISAGAAVDDFGSPHMKSIGLMDFQGTLRRSIMETVPHYSAEAKALETMGDEISALLKLDKPVTLSDFADIAKIAEIFAENEKTDAKALSLLSADIEKTKAYINSASGLTEQKKNLTAACREEFLSEDMSAYRSKLAAAEKKLIGKSSAVAAVRNEIQGFFSKTISVDEIEKCLDEVEKYQNAAAKLEGQYSSLGEDEKKLSAEFSTEAELRAAFDSAAEAQKKAESFPGGLAAVLKIRDDSEAADRLHAYSENYSKFISWQEAANNLLTRKPSAPDTAIQSEAEFCDFICDNIPSLKDKALYNQIKSECFRLGLRPVVDSYEENPHNPELVREYREGLYYRLINLIINEDDVLGSFSGATFNESIRQFKKIDDELMQRAKQEIYDILAANVPGVGESPNIASQLNLLRKAIGSNARGMSIRALFERIPDILMRLTPCMLMSPNSVAQYLAQEPGLFDVVIFDEASQLPTCKAVGALARAKNAVIVGDPKQMPPTSFFAGSGPAVEDLALDDLDSILDDALALGFRSQYLKWHYRSTHESLIAFSNRHFYENKMFTFPSANDREQHVTAVHVDGAYKKSVNPPEAEAVVEEVIRRFSNPLLRNQSIGIVTFNTKQQDLIFELLSKQFQNNPGLDAWANGGDDPLFIKNLENVQGDERDVILFSIGYGPDEKGHISMNFGPINKQGGGKRLNVAFSRARVSMVIFSSLYSSDIKLTPSSPEGLIAFHDFLKFAEGQSNATSQSTAAGDRTGSEGIADSICKALESEGFACERNIGHSDFHIDIAVINPFVPTQYLFGILLDGENYKRTKNTRDREIAQMGVLRNLGWELHRVWAIDWWDNRTKELSKLLNTASRLKDAAEAEFEAAKAKRELEEAEEKRRLEESEKLHAELAAQAAEVISEAIDDQPAEAEESPAQEEKTAEPEKSAQSEAPADSEVPEAEAPEAPVVAEEPETESAEENAPLMPDKEDAPASGGLYVQKEYTYAQLPDYQLTSEEYSSPKNKNLIADRILKILDAEAPMPKDVLFKTVMKSFGVSKSVATSEATEKAAKAAKVKNSKQKGEFYSWLPDQDPKEYRTVRINQDRRVGEICQQELKNAICYAIQENGALGKDDLIKEASKVFGYKRLGGAVEAAMLSGLQYAKSSGEIALDADGNFNLVK